ncbi:Transposase DDE domain-containing protein [Nitrosospira multiformis]|uniref:Transposase DDE domain-containing protein n=1 Tax=Nitrosospira multiformis TaxID=1231 RepID=A0A1H8QB31_9PROT|nr:Transposase DDE domain-containing protein [Nitrosospira multiformis]
MGVIPFPFLFPGQVNDCTVAPELIARLPQVETIADKGYDSERIRETIESQGARPVIPRKRNSVKGNRIWIGNCIGIGIWWKTPLPV